MKGDFFALPPKNAEHAIAIQLLGQESALDLDIVDALVGQPKRYSDLRHLLKGKDDKVLDRALARLQDHAIIQQGYDVQSKQKRYSLTTIGKLVLYRVQQLRPYEESLDAYRKARAAAEAA
jgi:DNA-binding HxlR family transcriptional regulator